MSGERIKNRLLALLIGVPLIPYVLIRFPRETRRYMRDVGLVILDGKRR